MKCIAEGSVAHIFLTEVDGQPRILKTMKPDLPNHDEALAAFRKEAECARLLGPHPHILPVLDYREEAGQAFLLTEYMDGGSLFDRLAHRQPLDVDDLFLGMLQILSALQCVHDHHIVHRDVNPENILFNHDGQAKLADFGIARIGNEVQVTEYIEGKFQYMSPEQAWGDRLDPRSDLFSVAAILYEIALDHPLYPSSSIEETLACARIALYPPPRDIDPMIDPALESLLVKGLALDKNDRFQSATDFSQALSNIRKVCAKS